MESISPDIAKKLLSRDFANLISRVQKGGKLTRGERVMLQTMATGTGAAPTVASSYVELAGILRVTRQTINTWKKRKGAPKPAYNRAVGGASQSQHVEFTALDIRVQGVSPQRVYDRLLQWRREGRFRDGLGLYPSAGFVHIDTRPRNSTWRGA